MLVLTTAISCPSCLFVKLHLCTVVQYVVCTTVKPLTSYVYNALFNCVCLYWQPCLKIACDKCRFSASVMLAKCAYSFVYDILSTLQNRAVDSV